MAKRSDKEEQDQDELKMFEDEIKEEDTEELSIISSLHTRKTYYASGLKDSFHATQMEAAEQFNDVIFKYYNERKIKIIYRFLNAKHKRDESKRIQTDDLLNVKRNAEFSLIKYFLSYNKIIRNQEFNEENSEFKDFIICTNIDLKEELKIHFDEIKEEDDILYMKLNYKEHRRLKFKKGDFPFKEYLINKIKDHARKIYPDVDFNFNIKEDIESFLDKLVLAVNFPNEMELGEIIENEIGQILNVEKNNFYCRFQVHMIAWMSKKEGEFLSHKEAKLFFEEIRLEIQGNIWFNMKDPVTLFTGREEELKKLNKTVDRSQNGTIISQMTIVSGLGGIGKTELVRKYAKVYGKKYYNNVLWINAEQYETLKESFFELAKDNRLGIPTKDEDGRKKTIESIVKEIYNFFAKKKSLFIFDNAETYNELKKFLPIRLSTAEANRHYILITSRCQEWEKGMEVIKLNELEPGDAIEFVKKGLDISTDIKSKDHVIENLLKKLQCFPLAIHQAIAFIEEEGLTRKFEIDNYLKLYDQMEKDLLNSDVFQGIENDYTQTTFNTWEVTIDKIQADTKCGQLAMKILNIISYFAPEDISRCIFLNLEDVNEELLYSAVGLLVKYSMINGEECRNVLSIHRLVQQVTRIKIKDQNEEEKIVEEVFQLLKTNFPHYSDKVEDYKNKRHLLPHLEIFLSHIDNLVEKKPDDKQRLEKHYIADLLNWIFDVHFDVNDNDNVHHEKLANLLERALTINEKYFSPDRINAASTLEKLGNAHGTLGDNQKKKELLERALRIDEMHYGPDNFNVARTLENLGNTYGSLGDYQKNKEYLERALKVNEMHYGPDNFNLASTLENLGIAYGYLGDDQKKKELLERALRINNMHYGPVNFKVARILENLGNAYGSLGDYQKNKEYLERALNINELHYDPDNFILASTLENLGIAYGCLGDDQKKKNLLERALRINEMHYGPDNFNVARILENLGNAYGSLGDYHKNKEYLERALKVNEMHYGPDNFTLASTLENLGIAYGCLGDNQKKKELLERALTINEMHYGSDNFNVARTIEKLGNAYGTLGYPKKQKELLERALKINEKHYGIDHINVPRRLENF